MSSNNGKEKLIAKIQHFYDLLIKHADENKYTAVANGELYEREKAACLMHEYAAMAHAYVELFKEFLHAEPGDA